MRSFNRGPGDARPFKFEMDFTENADGSVLVSFGRTKVLCTAFLEEKVPPFLRNQKRGWVTAEYGMIPGATHTRTLREAARGKQSGRTVEISRLIGRCLRTCIDFEKMGERTVTLDCDVIQADGGTRTASITGGCVALFLCLWKHRKKFSSCPIRNRAVAISLGVVKGSVMVDLDYSEDFAADVDLNLVMDRAGRLIEIQGTAEKNPFTLEELQEILKLGGESLAEIAAAQAKVLMDYGVDPSWVP